MTSDLTNILIDFVYEEGICKIICDYKKEMETCELHKLKDKYLNEWYQDWEMLSCYQCLDEDFIKEFDSQIKWDYILKYQKLSEKILIEYNKCFNKKDWSNISRYQRLSEKFIKRFRNKVDWYYISKYQKLSEKFIKRYKYKVNWYCISRFQILNKKFVLEFKDKIYLKIVKRYQNIII
jgi:hypothetical protein